MNWRDEYFHIGGAFDVEGKIKTEQTKMYNKVHVTDKIITVDSLEIGQMFRYPAKAKNPQNIYMKISTLSGPAVVLLSTGKVYIGLLFEADIEVIDAVKISK